MTSTGALTDRRGLWAFMLGVACVAGGVIVHVQMFLAAGGMGPFITSASGGSMDIQSFARRSRVPATAWAVALAASTAFAAPAGGGFTLQGAVIASGGVSRASSACFDMSATIGEPAAGIATGNGVALVSGFWAAPVERPDQLFRSSFERCAP